MDLFTAVFYVTKTPPAGPDNGTMAEAEVIWRSPQVQQVKVDIKKILKAESKKV